jgi:ATP-binding cassette, subfamily C, bacterial EexD
MNKRMSKLDSPDLVAAFHAVKRHFIYAGAFSAAVNILLLVPIIYMLQVYDRVMASGSYSTLIMLTVLMMALLMAMGGFEWVRSRILVAASNKLDAELRERIVNITFNLALLNPGSRSSAQPVNDLNGLRQFLTGNGIFAFFDAPWFPIYLAVMFMFHFWFGVMGIIAAVIMVALAWTNEKMTNKRMQDANSEANQINARLVSSLRNAEVIEAMGMTKDIREGMQRYNARVMALQSEASNLAGGLTALSKSFRMIMQSLTLGLGALLALQHEISAGAVIAGSLLLGRALAPIDIMVGTWKGFSVARAIYGEPKLLVLDEPNSNLDDQGEKELVAAISRIKSTGCAIVIISHRTMILAGVDSILVLKEGAAAAYGPRDQVMGMLGQPNPRRSAADAA